MTVPKSERYFSGMPLEQDPSKPQPGEMPPGLRQKFIKLSVAVVLVGVGVVLGVAIAPEAPETMEARVAELESLIKDKNAKIAELNRSLSYNGIRDASRDGSLHAKDRQRHELHSKRYTQALRKLQAQPAAELVEWFVGRWNQLLDRPMPDDRISRRAEALSLLVGGMGKNLHPQDYVPWQAEFLNGGWLGEVHLDLDRDGLPAPRTALNTHDSFANQSVCHVAMAVNQAVTDARVLMMPEMRCDSPRAKMSVFLQGHTWNDALDELVKALRLEGFLVVEKTDRALRLILVGPGTRAG